MRRINLKNNKGAALVYVLIALMVFGILGVAILTMASFSTNLAFVNYNTTQAGYSARSAVEATISYLSTNMDSQNLIPAVGQSATVSDLMTSSNINGSYKVKIERIDLYTAKVTATAKVGNMTGTMAASITLTLPGQKTANLENYAAYLKNSTTKITDTITIDQLNDANFAGTVLDYVPSNNININNLTSEDFSKVTATKADPGWNTDGVTDINITEGGIYKYDGSIQLNRDTTITLANQDAFLFLNGSFYVNKYCTIKRQTGTTGTLFIIFCGSNREFYVDGGAGGLNYDKNTQSEISSSLMANLFIYGPDVLIERKNKYYYKGAVIVDSYDGTSQSGKAGFRTAYLKPSATIAGVTKNNVSPWEVLFDKFSQLNIQIVPPTGGSVNSVTWDKNVNEIPLS